MRWLCLSSLVDLWSALILSCSWSWCRGSRCICSEGASCSWRLKQLNININMLCYLGAGLPVALLHGRTDGLFALFVPQFAPLLLHLQPPYAFVLVDLQRTRGICSPIGLLLHSCSNDSLLHCSFALLWWTTCLYMFYCSLSLPPCFYGPFRCTSSSMALAPASSPLVKCQVYSPLLSKQVGLCNLIIPKDSYSLLQSIWILLCAQ